METRYERNIPALCEEECARLRARRAAVIGCGGLGGHLIELLVRVGVGHLRVVDGDVFEPSNLNRQLYSAPALLGCSKAKTAAERVRRVNPEIAVEAIDCFLTRENARALIAGCDAVLDALDSIESRRILAEACAAEKIPYIYGAVSGWVAQAAISMPADDLIARLYPDGAVLQSKSVLSFTPALCASVQAALCVKLLTGRPVESGKLFYFDLLHQEFEAIAL